MSQELGWRRQGIPGGGTKEESLGVSREQQTVQLGKITEGRRDPVWGATVCQREGP